MKKRLTNLLFLGSALALTACMDGPQVPPKIASMPAWSPTGDRIVYVCADDGPFISSGDPAFAEYTEYAYEICVMDKVGNHKVRLTHNKTVDKYPVWSPDGRYIAFIGGDGLYTITPDGTSLHRLVDSRWIQKASWSPDGNRLAFSECRPEHAAQISIVNISNEVLAPLITEDGMSSENPVWSPDGNRLAYQSSAGNCWGTWGFNDSSRLRVFDISNSTSAQITSNDLKYVYGVSWLSNNDLTFYSQGRVPGSDAIQFYLYVVNIDTQEQSKQLEQVRYGRTYAWSYDKALIAYDTVNQLYVTPSSAFRPTLVWKHEGLVQDLSWSVDKQYILVSSSEPVTWTLNSQYTNSIWLVSQDGTEVTRLTEDR